MHKLFLRINTGQFSLQLLGDTPYGTDVIAPKPLKVLFEGETPEQVKFKLLDFLNRIQVLKFDSKTGRQLTLSTFLVTTRQVLITCGDATLPEIYLNADEMQLVLALPELGAQHTL